MIRFPALCFLLSVAAGLCGCAPSLPPPDIPLAGLQVVSVLPGNESRLFDLKSVAVGFSQPVNPDTVNAETFLVVFKPPSDLLSADADFLNDAIEDGDLVSLPGTYRLDSGQTSAEWIPDHSIEEPGEYGVILTSAIETPGHYPLTQTPLAGNTPFTSLIILDDRNSVSGAGDGADSGTDGEGPPDASPAVPWVEKESPYFSEIVADPQRDWNDTAGGNSIPFDGTPGAGTIGSTDEWIEIKNGSDDIVDLTGWKLEMIDGTDETYFFGEAGPVPVFFDGGAIENFNPDEFLVIGNPPGDIKNEAILRLLDDEGALVDEAAFTDANADGLSDESVQLTDEGEWLNSEASIGF